MGEVTVYKSVWQRFRPNIKDNWRWKEESPGGGLLFDLGSHMVFQVVSLFGLPDTVTCFLRNQRGGVDDCFLMILGFKNFPELLVELESSLLVPAAETDAERLFFVHGKSGSFEKKGMDVQEGDMRKGENPKTKIPWVRKTKRRKDERVLVFTKGVDPKKARISSVENDNNIPTLEEIDCEPGRYTMFYEGIAECIKSKNFENPPIIAKDSRDVIKILEEAKKSHIEKKTIELKWE